VVFVPFTAPGDEVEAEVTQSKKNYFEGAQTKVISPSPNRAIPPCPVFTRCGGCTWQHIPYGLQFETKKKGLLFAFKRTGIDLSGVPIDEMPAETQYHYRNRVQLRGESKEKKIGFYARGGNDIVAIDHCPIARHEINQIMPKLAEEGFKTFQEFKLEIEVSEDGSIKHAFNRGHAAFGFRQVNDEQNE
jgi:23S rRNA (uracil1939-C5)-methyltransferase